MFLNTFRREHILLKLKTKKSLRKIKSKNLTAGFFFFFLNSFVERGVKVASAALAHVVATCCSSYKILRSVYTLNGVSHAEVAKSRADPEHITRCSIRKSRALIN